jgi:3-hydroxybutyryl-CoA dehydrogenase
MNVIVYAHDWQKEELLSKSKKDGVEFIFADSLEQLREQNDADACFVLKEIDAVDTLYGILPAKPVMINSVIACLSDLNAPSNFHRVNGWASFLKRNLWEVATTDEHALNSLMSSLGYEYKIVRDEPGFVAARVVSMIINEAHFALEQNVSTKKEIDIAMKLGTNYPFGPFEWGEKIGLANINKLLSKLNETDPRYKVCSTLVSEI